jgi:hypothetical protein
MAGQRTSAASNKPLCWAAEPSVSEWIFAATASPNAPNAVADATWRAAKSGGFRRRERS